MKRWFIVLLLLLSSHCNLKMPNIMPYMAMLFSLLGTEDSQPPASETPITKNFLITGNVTGLQGSGLQVTLNSSETIPIAQNGSFQFTTKLSSGQNYTVVVTSQPISPSQNCIVNGGSGNIGNTNVGSLFIVCSTSQYYLSGSITGLNATGLVLQSGSQSISINSGATSFTFPVPILDNSAYLVVASSQPISQNCTVNNGSGTISSSNVQNIQVNCSIAQYPISGSITGLSGNLTISDGSETITLTNSSSFLFSKQYDYGASYSIQIVTQPINPYQTCSINNSSGTITGPNTNTTINCTTNSYTISGTINGLNSSGLVLQNNSLDNLAVSSGSTTFSFPVKILSGANYSITVLNQPTSPPQICTISGGTGSILNADVSSVTINCIQSYTIGGTVTGLNASTGALIIQNNINSNQATITANGSYSFSTSLLDASSYNISVIQQPTSPWQTCTITNPTGSINAANVTNININCSLNQYNLVVTVKNKTSGTLVLQNNNWDNLNVTTSGTSFDVTFANKINSGGAYWVSVLTSNPGQTCMVFNDYDVVTNADVPSGKVIVDCNPSYQDGVKYMYGVRHYRLSETSGNAIDYIGGVNNGVYTNITKRNVAPGAIMGDIDNATYFDGVDDYIQANQSGLPTGASPRTMCAWVFPIKIPTTSTSYSIIGYGSSSYQGSEFRLLITDKGWSFYGNAIYGNYITTVKTMRWHHTCLTYDGSKLIFFLNGIYQTAFTIPLNTATSGSFRIGNYNDNTGMFYGKIDEVSVMSKDLSAPQILTLYQLGHRMSAGYSLNGGSTDLSGNANHLIGAGSYSSINGFASEGNGAFYSNAGGYLTTTLAKKLPIGNSPKTLCVWLKIGDNSANKKMTALSFGGNTAGSSFDISYNNGILGSANLSYFPGTYKLPMQTWNHACLKYDGTNTTFYLNGNPFPPISPAISTAAGELTVATDAAKTVLWNGTIDEPRLFNVPLTDAQIKSLSLQVSDGLVAYYDMSSNPTGFNSVIDSSGLENHLSSSGGVSLVNDRLGFANRAYKFNGVDGFLSSTGNDLPYYKDSRTMCAWVQTQGLDLVNGNMVAIYGSSNLGAGSGLGVWFGNKIRFSLYGTSSVDYDYNVIDKVWNHLCYTYDTATNTSTIYLNGFAGTISTTITPNTIPNLFTVGKNLDNLRFFSGSIDDLRIYNRVLSVQEVRTIASYHPMQTTAKVNYVLHLSADTYNLSSGSILSVGQTWKDLSGLNWNASPVVGQEPKYISNVLNGRPALEFNGNQVMKIANAFANSAAPALSIFVVNDTNGPASSPILSTRDVSGANGSNGWRFGSGTSNLELEYFDHGLATPIRRTITENTGVARVLEVGKDSSTIELYQNAFHLNPSITTPSPYKPSVEGNTRIGVDGGITNYYQGNIGEIIIFESKLTAMDRIIVNCYLSAKYGIILGLVCN